MSPLLAAVPAEAKSAADEQLGDIMIKFPLYFTGFAVFAFVVPQRCFESRRQERVCQTRACEGKSGAL